MLFLRGYGDSRYADDARGLLSQVMEEELAGTKPKAPAAPRAGPSAEEQALFEAAQANPTEAAYAAYLEAFPKGTFAEFAQQELAALREKSGHDPEGGDLAEAKPEAEPAPEAEVKTPGIVTFLSPLDAEVPEVNGRSIADLIGSSPIFPPIEGLPESLWKGQSCSNCHEWTRERICTQANTYLSLNMQRSLDKAHPFGGALKRNLKAWAAGGCL